MFPPTVCPELRRRRQSEQPFSEYGPRDQFPQATANAVLLKLQSTSSQRDLETSSAADGDQDDDDQDDDDQDDDEDEECTRSDELAR